MSGSPLLAFLPVLAFLLLGALLLDPGREELCDWARALVFGAVGWGVYVAVSSELLSLLGALRLPWVALVWLLPSLGLGWILVRRGSFPRLAGDLRLAFRDLSSGEKMVLVGMVALAATLLAVALISPPNTYDSALYHMARVVHWAQNGSLRPYPVGFEHQLHKPIWAETAILHLRTLWGNDRPANAVQWFSMVGSLVVAAGIAARLGGSRRAQLLAAAFTASIPMGVLQATSTQNDYVAALWAVCLAYLVVVGIQRSLSGWELAALAGTVGLGALTKGTFFVYGPPFVAWFLLHELRRAGFRRALGRGLLMALVAVVLNAGFWLRNIAVYGGPYGTSTWLQQNLWIRLLEEPAAEGIVVGGAPARSPEVGETPPPEGGTVSPPPGGYPARLAQTAARNLTFPTGLLSRPVTAAIGAAPGIFGEAFDEELRAVSWNHEDFAGNPLHLLLVLVSLPVLVASARPANRPALGYTGVVLATYALIPIVIRHGPSVYGIRYQLSFFVLAGPLFAVAAAQVTGDRFARLVAAGLLLLAVPWVLLNKTRPLMGLPPTRTLVGSILTEDQETILVPWNPGLRDDYRMSAEAVRASGCRRVALRAGAAFPEYPLWWLLDAPQSGIRIEAFEWGPHLAGYVDPEFQPCAVICANCDQEATLRGLPLYGTYDSMKVYLVE